MKVLSYLDPVQRLNLPRCYDVITVPPENNVTNLSDSVTAAVNVGELVSVEGTTGDQSMGLRKVTIESQPIEADDARRGRRSRDIAESPIDPEPSSEDDEAVNVDTIESWDTRTADVNTLRSEQTNNCIGKWHVPVNKRFT